MFIFFSENKSNQTITQFSSWVFKKKKKKEKEKEKRVQLTLISGTKKYKYTGVLFLHIVTVLIPKTGCKTIQVNFKDLPPLRKK